MKKITRYTIAMEKKYEDNLSCEEATAMHNDLSREGWDVLVSRDEGAADFAEGSYHLEAQRQVVYVDERDL